MTVPLAWIGNRRNMLILRSYKTGMLNEHLDSQNKGLILVTMKPPVKGQRETAQAHSGKAGFGAYGLISTHDNTLSLARLEEPGFPNCRYCHP